MKRLILIVLFFAALGVRAQEVIIVKKDGSKVAGRVSATSATTIFLPGQNIKLTDIASVDLQESGTLADDLTTYLTKAAIPVTVLSQSKEGIVRQEIKPAAPPTDIESIDLRLEKFAVQRKTGKLMQIVGALALGVAASQVIDEPQTNKILSFVSSGAVVAGIAIDIDASRHLRKK